MENTAAPSSKKQIASTGGACLFVLKAQASTLSRTSSAFSVKMVSDDKHTRNTGSHIVPAEEQIVKLKADSQAVEPRERLSAYFTIAAAAFGLISDGCKCLVFLAYYSYS